MASVLAVLVSLATLFIAGDACNLVPVLKWSDACLKACNTTALYNVCQEKLQRAPEAAEVTVYALLVARLAKMSYDDTVAAVARLIAGGTLPGDERASYLHCVDSYATARIEMAGVITDLNNCDFARTRREYRYSVAAMASCGDGLKARTPLGVLNAADRDLTLVASDLGALVLGTAIGK
ncbi:hypothetical protein QOZ80_8AG0616980 [Eleusine coracana subsp. coracana]|nr:hypothetical protein QOZ80_8AG0616980 [Eleusine coracana subsp. coracana]